MTVEVARMHNWGRWLRTYHLGGQAWSLEGNYRSKDDDGLDSLTRPGRRPSPDPADAWDIEIACRLLPLERHLFLRLLYVARYQAGIVCRVMRCETGIRLAEYEIEAYDGMTLVLLADALEAPAVVRMERSRRIIRRILLTTAAETVS